MEIVQHATDDTLERNSMRSLPAPESDGMEEHLLVCSACRDRFKPPTKYVAAMHEATGKTRESRTASFTPRYAVPSEIETAFLIRGVIFIRGCGYGHGRFTSLSKILFPHQPQ